MLKKIFGKHFNVFNVLADRADSFIKLFSLHCAGLVHNKIFFYDPFSACLFVCLHAGHDASTIAMFYFYV